MAAAVDAFAKQDVALTAALSVSAVLLLIMMMMHIDEPLLMHLWIP